MEECFKLKFSWTLFSLQKSNQSYIGSPQCHPFTWMIDYSNIHDMNKLTNNKSTQGRGSVIRYMYQVWYFVSFLRCFYLDIMAIMKPTNMSKISTVTFLFFKKNQMSDCICFTHFLYPCPRSCDCSISNRFPY